MELRKNPDLDLDKKRGMFFNIGLAISLALIVAAFQWSSRVAQVSLPAELVEDGDVFDMVPLATRIESTPKPPKTQQALPKSPTPIFVEAANDELIEKMQQEAQSMIDDFESLPMPEGDRDEEPEEVFFPGSLQQNPEPIGGLEAFYAFISKHLKYPRLAKQMDVSGKVFVQFVIDKDGSLTDVEVIKGIGAGCDEEAQRVIAEAPKWMPGKQRGRPVKVRMVVPIVFKLS